MSRVVAPLLLALCACAAGRTIVLDGILKSVEADYDEHVRLQCGADRRASVHWYKDGEPVQTNRPTPLLRIKYFKAKDEGEYSCNATGTVLGIVLKLTEREYQSDVAVDRLMPESLSQHSSALVDNNTIDESNSSETRNSDKTFKDEDTDDKSENHPSYGHVDDSIRKFAPRFKHPSRMYAMEMKPAGSSIRLKCAAEGNPTPNITWKKNGGEVSRRFFQPSFGKWSMALEELTKTDNGNYMCVVCNTLGCINHTTTLQVQERYPSKPYIKEMYPGNHTVLVNDTVQLTCPPISDLEPHVYWMRSSNETAVDEEGRPQNTTVLIETRIQSDNSSDKPEQLTINNVTKEDEGWYVCVALNSLGNTTAKGYLHVLEC